MIMEDTFETTLTIEGSPTRVRVRFESVAAGEPRILEVSDGLTHVMHLLTALQLRQLRAEAMKRLGDRPFAEYQQEVLKAFKRRRVATV